MKNPIRFLAGLDKDHNGLSIEDYVKFDAYNLEMRHDYIQQAFPLDARSRFAPNAPILLPHHFSETEQRVIDAAVHNLKIMMLHMLTFYRGETHWREKGDHNHLRITRIICCLRLFGLADDAQMFYTEIRRADAGQVTPTTLEFWQASLKASSMMVEDTPDMGDQLVVCGGVGYDLSTPIPIVKPKCDHKKTQISYGHSRNRVICANPECHHVISR